MVLPEARLRRHTLRKLERLLLLAVRELPAATPDECCRGLVLGIILKVVVCLIAVILALRLGFPVERRTPVKSLAARGLEFLTPAARGGRRGVIFCFLTPRRERATSMPSPVLHWVCLLEPSPGPSAAFARAGRATPLAVAHGCGSLGGAGEEPITETTGTDHDVAVLVVVAVDVVAVVCCVQLCFTTVAGGGARTRLAHCAKRMPARRQPCSSPNRQPHGTADVRECTKGMPRRGRSRPTATMLGRGSRMPGC